MYLVKKISTVFKTNQDPWHFYVSRVGEVTVTWKFLSLPARAADFVIAVGTCEFSQNMGPQAVLHRALPDGLEKPSKEVCVTVQAIVLHVNFNPGF